MPGQPEPGLEYHTPLGHETPNVGPPSGPPHHAFNVPGPFHGNLGPIGMLPSPDGLKHLANHYIHNPRSHVEKLRVKRERTGRSKVLIVLEIDDTM
ncbi:hypothetical protein BC827DRAFT_1267177 [Russula dissimulans]|nr:hypothetical protein BC827DRAFT_1267177 [Russula dissimulans]